MDLVNSVLSFGLLLFFCRLSSTCYLPFLNSKFNITINNIKIARLLIIRPIHGTNQETQRKIGIIGIAAYVVLTPAAIYLWISTGSFDIFKVSGFPTWFGFLFGGIFLWFFLDVWVGIFIHWLTKQRKNILKNKVPIISKIIWNDQVVEQTKIYAEAIFENPQKVIWNSNNQRLYYIFGSGLLTLGSKGEFINLTQEGDSDFIKRLMRTEVCLFFSDAPKYNKG